MGPGSAQLYIPSDDPPPYSLLDPCGGGTSSPPEEQPPYSSLDHLAPYPGAGAGGSPGTVWFCPSPDPLGLQQQQGVASISLPLEAAPPYESVVGEQGRPLPLMPCDPYKHQSEAGGEGDGGSSQHGTNHILQDDWFFLDFLFYFIFFSCCCGCCCCCCCVSSGAGRRLRQNSHLRLEEQLPHRWRCTNNSAPQIHLDSSFIFLSDLCQKSELSICSSLDRTPSCYSATCCLVVAFFFAIFVIIHVIGPELSLESCDMMILAGKSPTFVNRCSWKQRHRQSDLNTPGFSPLVIWPSTRKSFNLSMSREQQGCQLELPPLFFFFLTKGSGSNGQFRKGLIPAANCSSRPPQAKRGTTKWRHGQL